MKHPLWLVNDFLFVLFLMIICFMFISRQKIPTSISLTPRGEIKLPKKAVSKIDLSKIYTNDLFETYQAPEPKVEEVPKITMPEPPTPKPVKVPLALPARFLEPLPVTLKGIIALADEVDNIALIQDNKTGSTKNYKANDKIEDAQIIRILSNKIILVRSNGQQEILYVSQYDAELDQQLHRPTTWSSIVQKKETYNYLVDPITFLKLIPNLAEFIDVFNLITVYKKGKSIGCRVGLLPPKSLPNALGLQTGDIIEEINAIPATTTDSRFEIYQKVIGLHIGDTLEVKLMRNNEEYIITYTLQQLEEPLLSPTSTGFEKSMQEIEAQKVELLRQQHQFAPTLEQIRMQQKRDMVNYGNTNRRNFNILNRQP